MQSPRCNSKKQKKKKNTAKKSSFINIVELSGKSDCCILRFPDCEKQTSLYTVGFHYFMLQNNSVMQSSLFSIINFCVSKSGPNSAHCFVRK